MEKWRKWYPVVLVASWIVGVVIFWCGMGMFLTETNEYGLEIAAAGFLIGVLGCSIPEK